MYETILAFAAGCMAGAGSFLMFCAVLAGRRNTGIQPAPPRAWRQLPAAQPTRIYGTFTINGHSRN